MPRAQLQFRRLFGWISALYTTRYRAEAAGSGALGAVRAALACAYTLYPITRDGKVLKDGKGSTGEKMKH